MYSNCAPFSDISRPLAVTLKVSVIGAVIGGAVQCNLVNEENVACTRMDSIWLFWNMHAKSFVSWNSEPETLNWVPPASSTHFGCTEVTSIGEMYLNSMEPEGKSTPFILSDNLREDPAIPGGLMHDTSSSVTKEAAMYITPKRQKVSCVGRKPDPWIATLVPPTDTPKVGRMDNISGGK